MPFDTSTKVLQSGLTLMASSDSRYFVISPPLTGKEAEPPQSWLGRFVSFLERPSEKYAPEGIDTEKFISEYFLDPLNDLDAKAVISSIKNKSLQTKLTSLLALQHSSDNEANVQLESPRMVTITLRQHERAFNALMEDPDILRLTKELLRSSKRKVYMIVGVKVIFNGRIVLVTDRATNTSSTITLPVAEAASTALGCPLPVASDLINPEVTFTSSNGKRVDLSHRFDNARIFAFEYRTVTLKTSLPSIVRRVSLGPTFSSLIPVGGNTLRFGNTDMPPENDTPETEEVGVERPKLLEPVVPVADIGIGGLGWEAGSINDGTGAVTFIFESLDEESGDDFA